MTGRNDGGGGYLVDGRDVPRVTELVALARLQAPWQESEPESAEQRARVLALVGPMGQHIHAMVASYPDEVACPPDVCSGECADYRVQFGAFIELYRPEFLARETPVYSRAHSYAGTPDWIARIGGKTVIGDVKTGPQVRPEVSLQLAAYRHADFSLEDGMEVPLPAFSGGVVLNLRADSFEFREVRCGSDVFRAFLLLRDFHEHRQLLETSVQGVLAP